MTDGNRSVDAVLAAVARRLAAADRLRPDTRDELLEAVAGLAVSALEAQAASIALYDAVADRLVFIAAAGPAAGTVVGIAIEPAVGIAGYAFTTGQSLAVADVATDPRFDRAVAEATGYVPSTLLAVPLTDATGSIGVLEVLDRRGGSFSLRDLDLATSIAGLATAAVRRGQIRRDATVLLEAALRDLLRGAGDADAVGADAPGIDELVSRATADLADEDDPTWALADRIARLRDADPDAIGLAIEWLDVVIRRSSDRDRRSGRERPT
jgi:GAF domain-containing protein